MSRRRPPFRRVHVKSAHEQELMRRAGKVVALALHKVADALQPGVTTAELDAIAEQTIRGLGAVPAFLNYNGFPATACISLDTEVVHGIPGPRKIRVGQLVKVDLGAIVEGWYADSAWTFAVGEVSPQAQQLMAVGEASLAAGIAAAKVGNRIRDIGAAVQGYVEPRGFSVVRDLCGHGIGRQLHEEPQVPNYADPRGGQELVAGMALAIEPMVNAGGYDVYLAPDHWTFLTADGQLSVHYEHTVLVQPTGPEVITKLG